VSLSRRQDTDKTLVCSYGSEQTNVNFVLQVNAMEVKAMAQGEGHGGKVKAMAQGEGHGAKVKAMAMQVKAMEVKAAALGMPKRLKYHLHAEISSWID
jgi:hypothetical protein